MVLPDEQREHPVREGEHSIRSSMALLQSRRARCGDVPESLRDSPLPRTQDVPRHANSAELVRTTVSDTTPGNPSPHVRGSANVISTKEGVSVTAESSGASRSRCSSLGDIAKAKAINKSSLFTMGSLVLASPSTV